MSYREDSATPSPVRVRSAQQVVQAEQEQLRRLLDFDTVEELLEFLNSEAVARAFLEFRSDYLARNPEPNAPNFNDAMMRIGQYPALYRSRNPDKHDWDSADHVARFIVRAYDGAHAQAAQQGHIHWGGLEEEDMAVAGSQLFEVLSYLVRRSFQQ